MEKQLTDKQEKLFELLNKPEYIKNPRAALDLAGYSKNSEVADVLEGLKDVLLKSAESTLLLHVLGCIESIIEVRDNPFATGAKAKLDAATQILDRAGLIKKDKLEIEHKVPSGILILPQKKDI